MAADQKRYFPRQPTRAWTTGQLRLALAGVPDQLPIRVLVPSHPAGDVTAIQVIYAADIVDEAILEAGQRDPSHLNSQLWFEICCEFRTGLEEHAPDR